MVTRKLPYYEFADGIYEINEFDCVSVFVIVGSTRALVIDCGTGIGDLRWVIENKITDKPYDVVATHNHGDHIGGAGFFDSIYIHPADMDWDSGNTLPTVDLRAMRRSLQTGRINITTIIWMRMCGHGRRHRRSFRLRMGRCLNLETGR